MPRRGKARFEVRVTSDDDSTTRYTLTDKHTGEVIYTGHDMGVALHELRRVEQQ